MSAEDKAGSPAGLGRMATMLGGSAWWPLAGKLAGYLAGFVALALIGSGAATWRLGRGSTEAALAMGLTPANPPAASPVGAASSADAPSVADAGATEAGQPDAAPADGGVTADGRVVLNLATEEDLTRLPGVGPTKAKAIIELRAKLGGRFRRPEDLLRVRGIGRRSLARLRPLLVVDP